MPPSKQRTGASSACDQTYTVPMVLATAMTLGEFLELPETGPPSEFVCGRVIPKPMPSWFHSRLAARLAALFEIYFMSHDEGFVNVELRHASREEERAYLPDVSGTRWANAPKSLRDRRSGPVETVPDLAIQIIRSTTVRGGLRINWRSISAPACPSSGSSTPTSASSRPTGRINRWRCSPRVKTFLQHRHSPTSR